MSRPPASEIAARRVGEPFSGINARIFDLAIDRDAGAIVFLDENPNARVLDIGSVKFLAQFGFERRWRLSRRLNVADKRQVDEPVVGDLDALGQFRNLEHADFENIERANLVAEASRSRLRNIRR